MTDKQKEYNLKAISTETGESSIIPDLKMVGDFAAEETVKSNNTASEKYGDKLVYEAVEDEEIE